MLLDLSRVPYMASAGLRLLLMVHRTIAAKGGKVLLVGLSPELKDTMTHTGFFGFFDHYDSIEAGIAALAS